MYTQKPHFPYTGPVSIPHNYSGNALRSDIGQEQVYGCGEEEAQRQNNTSTDRTQDRSDEGCGCESQAHVSKKRPDGVGESVLSFITGKLDSDTLIIVGVAAVLLFCGGSTKEKEGAADAALTLLLLLLLVLL